MTAFKYKKDFPKAFQVMDARTVLTMERLDAIEEDSKESFAEWRLKRLRGSVESAQKNLQEWKKRFEDDAFSAFRWAEQAVSAAAKEYVYGAVLKMADARLAEGWTNLQVWSAIQEMAQMRMQEQARGSLFTSSSLSSNQNQLAELQAWAKLTDGNFF
jgi:hypothetical protein